MLVTCTKFSKFFVAVASAGAAMEHSPHCSTALCCRRHPRACKAVPAVSKNNENCRGELYSPHTAILSAASPDAVTQQRWHAFSCLFAGAGDVYVASSSNPCASCSFEFVQISPRQNEQAWGKYIIAGLRSLYRSISKSYHHYLYARADMQWLADPRAYLPLVYASSSSTPTAYVPDTENYWGVNDRFAILNAAAADAYFVARASLLPTHTGNTETLLAAALKAASVAVRWLPTLGTLLCCAAGPRACHARGSSGLRQHLYVNDTSAHPQGFTICVKYIYEAQAAVQNAEGLKRGTAHLELCSSRRAECVRPTNPRAPHHCVPTRAVCVRPEPVIAWRAQWLGNETDWYRWVDPAPW